MAFGDRHDDWFSMVDSLLGQAICQFIAPVAFVGRDVGGYYTLRPLVHNKFEKGGAYKGRSDGL